MNIEEFVPPCLPLVLVCGSLDFGMDWAMGDHVERALARVDLPFDEVVV
jgi:hypothetical protein